MSDNIIEFKGISIQKQRDQLAEIHGSVHAISRTKKIVAGKKNGSA